MKKFDIELAKQGKPVVTRAGNKVTITCFDSKASSEYTLIGDIHNFKIPETWRQDGRYGLIDGDSRDLFMADDQLTAYKLPVTQELAEEVIKIYYPSLKGVQRLECRSYIVRILNCVNTLLPANPLQKEVDEAKRRILLQSYEIDKLNQADEIMKGQLKAVRIDLDRAESELSTLKQPSEFTRGEEVEVSDNEKGWDDECVYDHFDNGLYYVKFNAPSGSFIVPYTYCRKVKKEETNRRNRLDLMSDAEKAIYNATQEVEKAGASEKLTEAVSLLSKARDLVADHIENK